MFGAFFRRCPDCRGLFGARRTKVALVSRDEKEGRQTIDLPVGPLRPGGGPPIITQTTRDVVYATDVFDDAYRCSKCGRTWDVSRGKLSRG